ncbi:MAG TPA: phosphosulfolactate synthase [Acidimicrobiales bacterium]|nr:phosphosulfolactate synthase [Acidimicrobiales bacterium]
MGSIFLDLPDRSAKPRHDGMTMVIDNGLPQRFFADAVASAAPHIDVVKFGWGTAMVTPDVERKFAVLREHGIAYYFGGTLFEKFVMQDRFESFLTLCRLCRCEVVEISNGTIPLSNTAKAAYVRKCADEFTVLSEVGYKDPGRSEELTAGQWVDSIGEDLEAGATKVILEARESGRSGICQTDGSPRTDLVDAIVGCGVASERLIFEAPTKDLQTHFIALIGANVNLGNIAPEDVIGLETLRLGLRADTLLHFEGATTRA